MLRVACCLFACFIGFQKVSAQLISKQLLFSYDSLQVDSIYQNLGIPTFFFGIENGVEYYKVNYFTQHPKLGQVEVSGAIVLPTGTTCSLPIGCYMHGTTTRRENVPSRFSNEGLLGLIMAANGYLVALPDFIGLGDSPLFHPYQHAKATANAGIDLVRATKTIADDEGVHYNDQLFIYGYSQGGHAAMAMHREIDWNFSNEFEVTASAPMSGAYDMSGVMTKELLADKPYSSPAYLPYLVRGLHEIHDSIYDSLEQVFKPQYIPEIEQYYDGNYGIGFINSQLPDTIKHMFTNTMLNDFIQDSINHPFRQALRENDSWRDWAPNAPITLYFCEADEQVFYQNSLVASDSLLAQGAVEVNLHSSGLNNDHGACVQPSMINALSWFNTMAIKNNNMSLDIQLAFDSIAQTNELFAEVDGGIGVISYNWNSGAGNNSNFPISGGLNNYLISVEDANGCRIDSSFSFGTSSLNIDHNHIFGLYPQPATNYIRIKNNQSSNSAYHVYDSAGNRLLSQQLKNNQLDVSALPVGIYILANEQKRQRFSIIR